MHRPTRIFWANLTPFSLQVKLFYNEYSAEPMNVKSDKVYALVKGMQVKSIGLAQTLGQLCDSYWDFQSNLWANLRVLGQSCEFLVMQARGVPIDGVGLQFHISVRTPRLAIRDPDLGPKKYLLLVLPE
jgi:GH35 family endo-1,4-beta-xylanase